MHWIRWPGGAYARTGIAAAIAVALSGCATFSNDAGFAEVAALTEERTAQAPAWQRSPAAADAAKARVSELLVAPLTQQAAVELALINNPGLQATFQELGMAEADLVQAGRLRNPTFDFTRLGGGGATEIDRGIVFDVLALLTMPLKLELEQRRFARTQVQVAREAVAVGAEARRAWVNAVASSQLLQYAEQVKDAAELSAQLAQRMAQAGNFSNLARMQEQAFHAEATAQFTRARQQALADRERLTRILGLAGAVYRLPDRLPDLPKSAATADDVERVAMERRLDVLEARRAADAVAKSYELTRKSGFINVLDAGYASKSTTGEPTQRGYELSVELPLFDFGAVRNARAEATYLQAVERTREVAVTARSQAREAYAGYHTAYELARHYRDEVVPLRKRISEENQLRYNGMLISVFELLADSRDQVASVTAAIAAQRDFWLADIGLSVALTTGAPKS
jgi:outer membrane protein TolC